MRGRNLTTVASRFLATLGILVIVVLATRAGAQQATTKPPQSGSQSGQHDMKNMPDMQHGQMDMDDRTQKNVNDQMLPGHHHMGAHMHMTVPRTPTAADWARADQVVADLREGIEKYKDYRVALADGYQIFLPNLPQPMYHFTNNRNGFLESFTFDAARPTSLLYKKTASGYELLGAMYTMARIATEDQLNERVPLSVASWHLHTNLCMPKRGQPMDMTKFGLAGSISTQSACDAAGGRFFPVIFGWMVHVYPFEATREKVWEQ
jgi:hypothetical protein